MQHAIGDCLSVSDTFTITANINTPFDLAEGWWLDTATAVRVCERAGVAHF